MALENGVLLPNLSHKELENNVDKDGTIIWTLKLIKINGANNNKLYYSYFTHYMEANGLTWLNFLLKEQIMVLKIIGIQLCRKKFPNLKIF